MDSSTVICRIGAFVILGVSGLLCHFSANNVESDQTTHYVVSDLGLHCLPMTLYRFQVRMG